MQLTQVKLDQLNNAQVGACCAVAQAISEDAECAVNIREVVRESVVRTKLGIVIVAMHCATYFVCANTSKVLRVRYI